MGCREGSTQGTRDKNSRVTPAWRQVQDTGHSDGGTQGTQDTGDGSTHRGHRRHTRHQLWQHRDQQGLRMAAEGTSVTPSTALRVAGACEGHVSHIQRLAPLGQGTALQHNPVSLGGPRPWTLALEQTSCSQSQECHLSPHQGKLRNVTCATLELSDLGRVSVGKSIPKQKFLGYSSWFFVDNDWGLQTLGKVTGKTLRPSFQPQNSGPCLEPFPSMKDGEIMECFRVEGTLNISHNSNPLQ